MESILDWEESHSQYVPPHVLWRLQSPDLAVVRPAVQDIPLRQLLGNLSRADASYYVEYLSLARALPALAGDVAGFFDLDRDLMRDHENVWIGNAHGAPAGGSRPCVRCSCWWPRWCTPRRLASCTLTLSRICWRWWPGSSHSRCWTPGTIAACAGRGAAGAILPCH